MDLTGASVKEIKDRIAEHRAWVREYLQGVPANMPPDKWDALEDEYRSRRVELHQLQAQLKARR